MRWGKLRPWSALIGPLLAVAVLTATPAMLQADELAWPKWLVAGLVAAGGVLVATWTPLLKARTDALAARITRSAERAAHADDAMDRLPGPKGTLVENVTNRALLGIHEAIPLKAGTTQESGLSIDLPLYVPRDKDADLRTALEAMRKNGGFVLLIGKAATGKTRSAYEAIRVALPRWRLLMPSNAADLTALAEGDAPKHCVVWLDETQLFLTGSDPVKAATVRRLLADRARPVILVGTIWPTYYDQLRTTVRTTDSSSEEDDLNSNSRQVLELARRFPLDSWTEPEWARAEELASRDPRIEQATHHRGSHGLAQVLSAAPELIHRWEQADNPFGQAVITAAVAARRCGHPEVLPAALLEDLSQEYLTGAQIAAAADDWFPPALEWACQPVLHSGGIAPLQPHAEAIGHTLGYTVSDILVDRTTPPLPGIAEAIPSPVWTRLISLATPQACIGIGVVAYYAGMPDRAHSSWQRAADAGHATAMTNLGLLLENEGDEERARAWYIRAADAGHTRAMVILGHRAFEASESESAERWLRQAAALGNVAAMTELGFFLAGRGDLEEAKSWYLRAAESGDSNAMSNLGYRLQQQGKVEEAEHWYRKSAGLHHFGAMQNLAGLLHERGDIEEALTWLGNAAKRAYDQFIAAVPRRPWPGEGGDLGQSDAILSFAELLAEQGRKDEAEQYFQQGAELGDPRAAEGLAKLHAERGDTATSNDWRRTAAYLAHDNLSRNRYSLIAAYGQSAVMRHSAIMLKYAEHLAEAGELMEAETWAKRAANQGSAKAMRSLAAFNTRQGRPDEAEQWIQMADATEPASTPACDTPPASTNLSNPPPTSTITTSGPDQERP